MNGPVHTLLSGRAEVNGHLPFSVVDGPGNRFVLFLQGCNFDCVACHNPYTINSCDGCGGCFSACPTGALSLGPGRPIVNRSICDGCDRCLDECPTDSSPLTSDLTVAEVLYLIRSRAPFLSGVTVSGGEATLQAQFVHDLFAAVKADRELSHLTTFVDTNGSATRAVRGLLEPVMDGAMVDLKAFDDTTHRRLTGVGNEVVKESIEHLAGVGLLHEVRLLIIPGHNDRPTEVAATGAWLHDVAPGVAVKVIGFRRHGTRPAAADLREPTADELDVVVATLRATGITHVTIV